jgi:hypothetical protein
MMQALLRLSLLLTMLCCCWSMLRYAPRNDRTSLLRAGRWMRRLTFSSALFLALWLIGLLRH